MDKVEILQIPNFDCSPRSFEELKTVLKAGKIVKNPFAKSYGKKVEVIIVQDSEIEQFTQS